MGNPILFVRAWTNFWSHRHFFLDDFQHALSAIFVNGGDLIVAITITRKAKVFSRSLLYVYLHLLARVGPLQVLVGDVALFVFACLFVPAFADMSAHTAKTVV